MVELLTHELKFIVNICIVVLVCSPHTFWARLIYCAKRVRFFFLLLVIKLPYVSHSVLARRASTGSITNITTYQQ